jgi:hypothetical protein
VRAEFVEEADPAVAVAECDEILAKKLDPHRRAIGLGDLVRQARRGSVAPQRLAHRGTRPDAGQQFVFLARQHGDPFLKTDPVIPAKAGIRTGRLP